jgi:hypothetical protein
MKRRIGDMWGAYGRGLFLITTNSYLRKDGALVMGRGIASQALERWPDVQFNYGRLVKEACGHLGIYGLLIGPDEDFGLFQVKKHFRASASPEIIQKSAAMLSAWCVEHPEIEVNLNYPGIGWGRLSKETVEPIISNLPDTVNIWTPAES